MLNFNKIRTYQRNTLPLYTSCVIDPISRIAIYFILKKNINLKPLVYTYIGLIFASISAYFFFNSNYMYGVIFFQISLVFDLIDGYVARIKNSGSIFGIISDGFVDFFRVFMNLAALFLSHDNSSNILNFFTIYFLYVAFENTINVSLRDCKNFFKDKAIKKNFIENKIIEFKEKFEKKKIRLIFFYYHERYFLIFFVGPITGLIEFFVYLTISLSFLFLVLKIFLDIALIKKN